MLTLDLNGDGNTGNLEISTRLKDSVRIAVNYTSYWSVNNKDTLYSFRRDNYLGIKITNYFWYLIAGLKKSIILKLYLKLHN